MGHGRGGARDRPVSMPKRLGPANQRFERVMAQAIGIAVERAAHGQAIGGQIRRVGFRRQGALELFAHR